MRVRHKKSDIAERSRQLDAVDVHVWDVDRLWSEERKFAIP